MKVLKGEHMKYLAALHGYVDGELAKLGIELERGAAHAVVDDILGDRLQRGDAAMVIDVAQPPAPPAVR
jgi:hypothetical protein